jgi:hypothetical protein
MFEPSRPWRCRLRHIVAPAANDGVVKPTLPQPLEMVDCLLVRVKGTACSMHGWPNFEPK